MNPKNQAPLHRTLKIPNKNQKVHPIPLKTAMILTLVRKIKRMSMLKRILNSDLLRIVMLTKQLWQLIKRLMVVVTAVMDTVNLNLDRFLFIKLQKLLNLFSVLFLIQLPIYVSGLFLWPMLNFPRFSSNKLSEEEFRRQV